MGMTWPCAPDVPSGEIRETPEKSRHCPVDDNLFSVALYRLIPLAFALRTRVRSRVRPCVGRWCWELGRSLTACDFQVRVRLNAIVSLGFGFADLSGKTR